MHFARGSRTPTVAALCAGTAALVALVPAAFATFRPSFVARRYAVATDNAEASRAAAEVLRTGGNAADAAVAAALALGIASPSSSGFGGGAFATICTPRGECTFLDFRETSPAALTVERIRSASNTNPRASSVGALAVAVPGEPAGLIELARRFGRIPLARSVAPAVALARNGFTVTDFLATRVREDRANLAHDPHLNALFFPGNSPVEPGSRLRRPRLAATLERYGREGLRYVHGPFASAIAGTIASAGGVLTADDVRAYRPVERAPLRRTFRGYTVVTAPPPSAGGIILSQVLALLDTLPEAQRSHGSSAYDHALAEAFRWGFDDRARYVGDPGATPPSGPTMADRLLDPARLQQRISAFDPAHSRPVAPIEPPRDHGTTHFCVMDADGLTVSITTTVNLVFGSRLAVPSLDVILNDEIDDFSLGTAGNNFGLANSTPNALAPGRRPVSSMSPTIVLRDGRPVGCVGAAGGPRIATATTQVLLNMILHNMEPEAAVSSPRIHHQGTPATMLVDREVPEDVRVGLRARGYTVEESTTPLAVAQALWVREVNGRREILAASDPRKNGAPAGQ